MAINIFNCSPPPALIETPKLMFTKTFWLEYHILNSYARIFYSCFWGNRAAPSFVSHHPSSHWDLSLQFVLHQEEHQDWSCVSWIESALKLFSTWAHEGANTLYLSVDICHLVWCRVSWHDSHHQGFRDIYSRPCMHYVPSLTWGPPCWRHWSSWGWSSPGRGSASPWSSGRGAQSLPRAAWTQWWW